MSISNIFRIVTLNICGLNEFQKRQKTAQVLQLMGVDILCLQETHIEGGQRSLLNSLGFKIIGATTHGAKVKGVGILARKTLPLTVNQVKSDPLARWVIISCSLPSGFAFTICSIYASNLDDPAVIDQVNEELVHWPLPMILCGDLNLNLPSGWVEDTTWSYKGRKPTVFRAMSDLIGTHGLQDAWAYLKPKQDGYSFFSAPHLSLARLDFFLCHLSLPVALPLILLP